MNTALRQMRDLSDMIKFEHTVFALPFAFLGALAAAQGLPPFWKCTWILAAMVGARTAAMTFNRLADADVDRANPRTAMRHIPAGRVPKAGAIILFGAGVGLFGFSAGMLGPLCWKLAPLAMVIILGYSLCKRFTSFAHLVLGLSLAGAPLGAWIAVRGEIEAPALWLAGGVLAWTGGFDILYALQDEQFDRAAGLRSVPATFGTTGALWISRLLHVAALLAWGRFNLLVLSTPIPWLGWLAVAGILAREQWLVRDGKLDRIDEAFFTMNSLVGLVFFAGHAVDLFLAKTAFV